MTVFRLQSVLRSKFTYALPTLKRCGSQATLKTENSRVKQENTKLSTLFVPSRCGNQMYQIVKPTVDINYITDNLGNLKLSCDHRGIEIDLDYTLKIVCEWVNMRNDYEPLCEKEKDISDKLKSLDLSNPIFKSEAAILQEKKAKLIEKIIVEKEKLYVIEDIMMPLLQKMPHILHPNTPLQFSLMDVSNAPHIIEKSVKSHMDIAHTMLEFSNNSPITYFMKGKLSHLDIAIQSYFTDKFSDKSFLPLSCADFCKSFIIEAIGLNPYSNQDCIKIKSKGKPEVGQKTHLVGGASLESLCAYLTNMNVFKSVLPIKYFSLGRHYSAAYSKTRFLDLFSVVQSNNVHCIILSEPFSVNAFDNLLQAVLECYLEIDVPFRTVNISAKNLTIAESRRTELELWAPSLKDYVPVAYVSEHDDFISKRLQITYGEHHQKDGYCSIVEGAVLNVPTLIGCIVENFQTKNGDFEIPDVLKKYLLS